MEASLLRSGRGEPAVRTPVPRLVMLDSHDSFTYNLVQILEELGATVEVVRTDATGPDTLLERAPDALVVSPGPGAPETTGVAVRSITAFAGRGIPVLGVCLGHQALAVAFGGRVRRAGRVMHGKTSRVVHDGRGVLRGLPSPFTATRYHSLVVDPSPLPRDLAVSARAEDGEIMGLRHRSLPVEGVQFHPESILTACGKQLLGNFLAGVARA